MGVVENGIFLKMSFLRRQESSNFNMFWIPAAGNFFGDLPITMVEERTCMTDLMTPAIFSAGQLAGADMLADALVSHEALAALDGIA